MSVAIVESLAHQATDLCADPRFQLAVQRHMEIAAGPDGGQGSPFFPIHPGDQMLLHSLQHHQHAGFALSQYFSISMQQFHAARQVLQHCFGPNPGQCRVLDFACGYGRLLRFLTTWLSPQNLYASEVQAEALRYVTRTFGVQGLASHTDPTCFVPGETFDFIWVASLFSHLPHELFKGWLQKLATLLTPGGVLCFSARGAELLPAGTGLPECGIHFEPHSELTTLAADRYGTAWVNEAYVRTTVDQLAGAKMNVVRLSRALAQEQDLYAVSSDMGRLSGLDTTFRRGSWGWLDQLDIIGDRIKLRGWAADMDAGTGTGVNVSYAGRQWPVTADVPRPDVALAFQDDRMDKTGWGLDLPLDKSPENGFIEISAGTANNKALIFAGPVKAGG